MSPLTLALIAAGAALRLAGLSTSPYWYDEAYSLHMTRLQLLEMVRATAQDFNPPLWELIVWPFVRVLGESEIALRLPSLLAGILSLYVTWLLADRLIESRPGRYAAVGLAALLPVGLWTAQDGRVYAVYTLLYLSGLLFALDRRWLGFAACVGLLCYCHNTGPMYAAGLVITALLSGDKEYPAWPTGCHHHLTAGIAGGLAFLPWLPAYLVSRSGDFWLGGLTGSDMQYSTVQAFFVGTITNPALVALAVIALTVSMVLAVIFSAGPVVAGTVAPATVRIGSLTAAWLHLPVLAEVDDRPKVDNKTIVLMAAVVMPLGIMLAVSLAWKNILFYRPLVPLVIPVCLWFAAVLTPRRITMTTWILPCTWIILVVAGMVGWSPELRGGDLRAHAEQINRSYQPGDVVYHATGTTYLPFTLYLEPGIPVYLLDEVQNDGLLRPVLQKTFDVSRAALEDIDHDRAWLIWSRDPVMSDMAVKRMTEYTNGGQLLGRVSAWQVAPIDIYLKGVR